MRVADFDVVYISYDEPNAEENYMDLVAKFPRAMRVHGVKGFDAAHQKAASLSESEFVFIVDGDNKVTKDFRELIINPEELDNNIVYSWASKNIINGLVYGNGGVKLWPTKLLSQINCHDSGVSTDFCYETSYLQMNDWYSFSFPNASPYQAFRTGFREGVKLCLDPHGLRYPGLLENIYQIPASNIRRLITWLTIGSDVTNGVYAIFGARLALLKTICEPDFDINIISDYEKLESFWNEELSYVKQGHFRDHYDLMANDIRRITSLPVSNIDPLQSETTKALLYNPIRSGLMDQYREEDYLGIDRQSFTKEF